MPVITSKLGGMATVVSHNHNGLLFMPNNADSLNEQIDRWFAFIEDEKHGFL